MSEDRELKQNAYASDPSYGRFADNGDYWNWYGYALSSIPAGSTIDGIEVNARGLRQSGCGSNCLMRVRLSYDSGTSWTSYINTNTWTTSNSEHIVGGPTNNWDRSWTRDEIVNNLRIQAYWQVAIGTYYGDLDYLPVRIYYTEGVASTYNISGYVINQTSGAVISNATVTTDSGMTTSTDDAGCYNFTLSNGTYLITASKTGYDDNSISRAVSGAAINNVNISLIPIPSNGGKILVATNRYVILDDWTIASLNGTGFSRPAATHIANSWTSINTKINATALFIDDSGSPLSGRIITFNLYMPNGTEYTAAKINATTNGNGLANFTYDMDSRPIMVIGQSRRQMAVSKIIQALSITGGMRDIRMQKRPSKRQS